MVPVLFVAEPLIPISSIPEGRASISISLCACRLLSTADGAAAGISLEIQKDAKSHSAQRAPGLCLPFFILSPLQAKSEYFNLMVII